MSDDDKKVLLFPLAKKDGDKQEQRTVAVKDIDCFAILTNKDEQYYIDNPEQIAQIMAFVKGRGFKWKAENYPQ